MRKAILNVEELERRLVPAFTLAQVQPLLILNHPAFLARLGQFDAATAALETAAVEPTDPSELPAGEEEQDVAARRALVQALTLKQQGLVRTNHQAADTARHHLRELLDRRAPVETVALATLHSFDLTQKYLESVKALDDLATLRNIPAPQFTSTGEEILSRWRVREIGLANQVTEAKARLARMEQSGRTSGAEHARLSKDYRAVVERHEELKRVLAELGQALRR